MFTQPVLTVPLAGGVSVTIRRATPRQATRLRQLWAQYPTRAEDVREIFETLGSLLTSPIDPAVAALILDEPTLSEAGRYLLALTHQHNVRVLYTLMVVVAGPNPKTMQPKGSLFGRLFKRGKR